MSAKTGAVHFLTKLNTGSLYAYLFVCAGCALAMLVNLAVQGVGVQAFNAGTYGEKLLLLLTIAVVAACAAGGTLLALAIRRKQMK